MESESTVNEKYFNKLIIEKLNEIVKKVDDYHKERDKAFDRIYESACKNNPKFGEMIDEEIRNLLKKGYGGYVIPDTITRFSEEQRKEYARQLWLNYLNKNECTH